MLVRRRTVRLAAVALALAAGACIPHRPTRTFDAQDLRSSLPSHCRGRLPPCEGVVDSTPATGTICTSVEELLRSPHEQALVGCYAHERHARLTEGPYPHDGFDLHVVEFDDEGQPWNADRLEGTLARVRADVRRQPALVALFVHGWKNDASVCNDNLSCFRDVLEILAKIEKRFAFNDQPRRVVGIYVGWRGGTIAPRYLKETTFWGRKHTAHTIGDNGGVTSFVRRLRTAVSEGRDDFERARAMGDLTKASPLTATSMVLVGHSFGAALLYSALGTSINGDAGAALEAARKLDGTTSRQSGPTQAMVTPDGRVSVRSQGDLVVLVNPAMEASRFANLASASKIRYADRQTPILVTLGSEADGAVKYAFPIGQSFSTVFRSARSRRAWFSMLEGFGLHQPYLTHRLSRSHARPEPRLSTSAEALAEVPSTCRCSSLLRYYGDDLIRKLTPYYEALGRRLALALRAQAYGTATQAVSSLGAYQEFLTSRLEPITDVDPNSPFLMIQVDKHLIDGHSDIFNARFLDFLVEFTVRSELKRRLYGETLSPSAIGVPARSTP